MTAREPEGRGIRADSLKQIKFRTQYIWKLKIWTLIPLSIPMYPLGSLCVPLTSRFHVSEVRKKVVPLTETQRSEEELAPMVVVLETAEARGKDKLSQDRSQEGRPRAQSRKTPVFKGVQAKETEIKQKNKEVNQDCM